MIESNLNEIIVNTVLQSVPKGIKPVSYLKDLLNLSRESVYRRIRREIPFSTDEIAALSLALGFSIDEIIKGGKKERMFFDLHFSPDFSETYIWLFKEYDTYLQNLLTAQESQVLIALNHIPPLFSVFFDNLFKFYYYKWLNENMEEPGNHSFSNLPVPNKLTCLQEKTLISCKKISNVIMILSPYVFFNLIKDIQYYCRRKLLTGEELELLKSDILNLIDLMEKIAKNGSFNLGARIDFYLSTLNIHSNSAYFQFDEVRETHFWIYSSNPMILRNSEICDMQKKWIYSMKKHSILITESNEILQIEFFNKQRKYVKELLAGVTDNKNFVLI
jgi:hypothetical protein